MIAWNTLNTLIHELQRGDVTITHTPMFHTGGMFVYTIPLLTVGFGRADASDGRVFPYVFTPPTNYWSQNTAKIRFIAQQVGGMAQLKGLNIAHVSLDNDYGRETLPILDR